MSQIPRIWIVHEYVFIIFSLFQSSICYDYYYFLLFFFSYKIENGVLH